ncbi:MAG: hypothetical protein R3C44_21925 [Chloroflexota bacterium]
MDRIAPVERGNGVPEPSPVYSRSPDRATIQADCNVVGATYEAGTDGSLAVILSPNTLAYCGMPPWIGVHWRAGCGAGYTVDTGALSITLQLENGTMIFVPAN